MSKRIGPAMSVALDYIRHNPGCNTAEVDRMRRTARGGHKWMYATVARLRKRGLIEYGPSVTGRGIGLYVVQLES